MKILQINNCHYRRGGADVVYLNTGELIAEKGEDIIYFSTSSELNISNRYITYFAENTDALKVSLVKQLSLVQKKLYSLEAKRKLNSLLQKTKPDVAHIHLYKGGLTASILSTLVNNRIPIVITLHDYGLLCPRNILFNADNEICTLCLTKSSFNCVKNKCNRHNLFYSFTNFLEYNLNNKLYSPHKIFSKIICVSKFNYDLHKEFRPNLSDQLVHLYNFSPIVSASTPNHKKGDYFLFFGRLSKEKGINTLIESIKGLPILLKIVGTGDLMDSLKMEKRENVEFLGFKTGSELEELIRDSSFVIVPSEWYENNPMTIIEAFAFGKPVIGSRTGGIPELIIENETGFSFEMGNVQDLRDQIIKGSIIDNKQYENLSINARKFAETKFSKDSHFESLMNIYNEAIISKIKT
ncbi:MAG: glycosyltransferase family 4 protein [Bacteroidales bacterium]